MADIVDLPQKSADRPLRIEWFSIALALAMLATTIFRVGPVTVTRHPWRVEMLTAVVLAMAVASVFLRDRELFVRILSPVEWRFRWILGLILGFIGWSAVSLAWAYSACSVMHHTLLWAEYAILLSLLVGQLTQGFDLRRLTGLFVCLTAVFGTLCIFDYLTLPLSDSSYGILHGRYGIPAEMLVTIVPVLFIATIYSRTWTIRLLMLICGLAGWFTAMLSQSKGALIAGIAGALVVFGGSLLFGKRRFRSPVLKVAGVWLAFTLLVQVGFSLFSSVPSTADYISGKADQTRETSMIRVMIWKVGRQMFADHWLAGVGADDFGAEFERSRARFRAVHRDDNIGEYAADEIAERAHNEVLQTAAELGIVGVVLMTVPFVIFAYWLLAALRSNKYRLSPMLWAAVGGMAAFGVSSMVSSFSFRLAQNGIAFIIVLAIAIHQLSKADRGRRPKTPIKPDRNGVMIGGALVAAALVLSLVLCATKALASYYFYLGDKETNTQRSLDYFSAALRIDPDFSAAYLHRALRYYESGDPKNSSLELRKALDSGMGVVFAYSNLAKVQTEAGDRSAAEATLLESLTIYPRSIFLRVRYATFMIESGRAAEAETQMAIARSVDPKQASGWFNIITLGSTAAFYAAQKDPEIALPDDLRPAKAVIQYLDKTPDITP